MADPNEQKLNRLVSLAHKRPDDMRRQIQAARCARPGGLRYFVELMWPTVEPARPFIPNWHIDAVCQHLEAVSRGEIKRLLINVSPGTSKSLLSNVFFPAWEWTTKPELRFLCFSYSQNLTIRDNVRFRQLIQSPEYRELWGHVFDRSEDQFSLITVMNNKTGFKVASSVSGTSTGARGERLVVDDPNNAAEAESVVVREATNTFFREVLPSRLANPADGAIVVIQQRVHQCLHPDTTISTQEGPRPISELSVGDYVLGRSGPQQVLATASRQHRGELLGIKVWGDPRVLWCTPEHRIWTIAGWQEARGLFKGSKVVVDLPVCEPISDDVLMSLWPPPPPWKSSPRSRWGLKGTKALYPKEIFEDFIRRGLKSHEMAAEMGLSSRHIADAYISYYGLSRRGAGAVDPVALLDPMFWRVAGYWVAEGSLAKARGHLNKSVFTFGETEDRYVREVEEFAKRHSIPSNRYAAPSAIKLILTSRQLAGFMTNFGVGAKNKKIPEFVFRLPPECRREFLIGYWRGDGSWMPPNLMRASTISGALVDGVRRLLASLGATMQVMGLRIKGSDSVVRTGPGKGIRITSRHPSYEMRWYAADTPWLDNMAGNPPVWRKTLVDDRRIISEVKEIQRKPYDGLVFDIATPTHDFWCGPITAHNSDVSGTIIENEMGFTHLMIPMMHDGMPRTTSIGWSDPREEEGELMWPAMYPQPVVDQLRRDLGPIAFAGQYQQIPVPRGGAIFELQHWQPWPEPGDSKWIRSDGRIIYPPMEYIVAAVDTAFTEKEENDFSACVVMGVFRGASTSTKMAAPTQQGNEADPIEFLRIVHDDRPKVCVMFGWSKRLSLHGPPEERPLGVSDKEWNSLEWRTYRQKSWGLVEWVADTCKRYKVDHLIIETQAQGHGLEQELRRLHSNGDWGVELYNARGGRGAKSKVERAWAVQHLFTNGLIYCPTHPDTGLHPYWAEAILSEAALFPRGRHDDAVDALVMGLQHLRDSGILVRGDEHDAEYAATLLPPHRSTPLYDT